MKERLCIAGFLIVTMMAAPSSAQLVNKVAQLGRMPTNGKVRQVGLLTRFFGDSSSSCDAGCGAPAPDCGCEVAAPLCDAPACGLPEPACGAPGMPSCGMAGGILGKFGGLRNMLSGFGGADCGCETMEPDCGVTGLGYGGGFGLCGGCGGGSCDSCGVGGFFGRNIHKVDPCACGGSLFGDVSRNFLSFFDQAVGTLAGSFVGGLRAAGGHARGSLAAMRSATTCGGCSDMGCDSCAAPTTLAPGGCALGICSDPLGCGAGCDAGCASSGVPTSYPVDSYPVSAPVEAGTPIESYPANTSHGYATSPAPTDDIYLPPPAPPATATESVPTPAEPNMIDTAPLNTAPIDASPLDAVPTDSLPGGLDPIDTSPLDTTPTQGTDPFIDDPAPLSRRQLQQQRPVASGFRVFNGGNPFRQRATSQQRVAGYQVAPQQRAQRTVASASRSVNLASGVGNLGQASTGEVRKAISQVRTSGQSSTGQRYLQARGHQATMRR